MAGITNSQNTPFMNDTTTKFYNKTYTNTTEESPWSIPPFDHSAKNIVLAIVLTLIDAVTILGNMLLLLAFVMEKRLMQPFNMFILNLAVTDFLVAITAMTFYTLDTLLGYWPFGRVMCGFWIYLDFAMTWVSVFTLVAISVDRFWAVTWAIHYRLNNTRRKMGYILSVIWLFTFAIWTPAFIGDRMKPSDEYLCIWEPSDNREYVIFIAVVGHHIPWLLMVFCYCKVFLVMRRQATLVATNLDRRPIASSQTTGVTQSQAISGSSDVADVKQAKVECYNSAAKDTDLLTVKQHEKIAMAASKDEISRGMTHPSGNARSIGHGHNEKNAPSGCRSNTGQSREKKIFITLTYVLSCYLVCWLPFYIAFDIYAWNPDAVPAELYTFFMWMTYVNSMLNPFIYAYTSKEFRLAFMKVLKCICMCK